MVSSQPLCAFEVSPNQIVHNLFWAQYGMRTARNRCELLRGCQLHAAHVHEEWHAQQGDSRMDLERPSAEYAAQPAKKVHS